MKLVEVEQTGPVEGEEAIVTPPRPPHRRVSVSLVFTLSVLVGLVVAIYTFLPGRHTVLLTEAIAHQRETETAWDLVAPSAIELRAWVIGVVGKGAPLPPSSVTVVGARRADIDNAALVRLRVGDDEVTYMVQHAQGMAPDNDERDDGDLRAIAWRTDTFECVAVGPMAHATQWLSAITPR